MSTSIREECSSTSAPAPHGGPVTVDQIPATTTGKAVEMINWPAHDLMNSQEQHLDPISEPDVEAAWSEEIERPVLEIDAGTVELIPWDNVRSELFGESEWRE